MTYSLGFRSPNQQELAADWFQHLVSLSNQQQRLSDPPDDHFEALGQLGGKRIAAAADLISSLPGCESEEFASWLGCYLTEPKPQFQLLPMASTWEVTDLQAWLDAGHGFIRHPWARFCWNPLADGRIALFVNGEQQPLSTDCRLLADHLCRKRRLDAAEVAALLRDASAAKSALLDLINQGALEPEQGTE